MNRRQFLQRSAAAFAPPLRRAKAAFGIIVQDAARPNMPCGVAAGDVTSGRAIVWSRTDRPARLIVDYSTSP